MFEVWWENDVANTTIESHQEENISLILSKNGHVVVFSRDRHAVAVTFAAIIRAAIIESTFAAITGEFFGKDVL